MANAQNPLRAQAEAFIALELDRVGAAALDKAGIVRRFVALGASKSRVHAWIGDMQAAAAPSTRLDDQLATQQAAAEGLAQDVAMAEAVAMAELVHALPPAARVEALATPVLAEMLDTPPVAVIPDGAKATLAHLHTITSTAVRVLEAQHTADGKVRNPRMALASAETLRRCLETSVKLYESINNVRQVERFMAEMLAEVGLLQPELAKAVIVRMRAVQARWAP